MTHTPTPWAIGPEPYQDGIVAGTFAVAMCGGDEIKTPVDKTNAAHIVRCVNSHDTLVAALRRARDELNDHWYGSAQILDEILDQIDAALATAKETP